MTSDRHDEPVNRNLPHVMFVQRAILHYRIPVFDELAKRCEGKYSFSVHGPMDGDQVFGGGQRDYFHHSEPDNRKIFGIRIERLPEIPKVVREHRPDLVIITLNPRCPECYKLPSICRQIGSRLVGWTKIHSGSVHKFVMDPLRRWLYAGYDRIICYGDASAKELRSLGYPQSRIDIAYNTIDTRRVFSDTEEIRDMGREIRLENNWQKQKVVLYIARFDPEKRHADLLAAWPALREIFPDMVLVLVGGGPLLEDVRRQAKLIDSKRIFVVGRVPEGMDYAWISAADVNVQCGAVGLAINQSMALGVPTVIADEAGVDAELVKDGVTGWRFQRGNPEALVAAIRQVFSDPEEAKRRVTNARNMMREDVTIEGMVDGLDGSIRKALGIGSAANRHTEHSEAD